MSAQTISAIVVSVMQALGHAPKPPEPAQAPPPVFLAAVAALANLVPERQQIRQFADLDEMSQLNILHAMHSRYGDSLRAQGVTTGEHRAAWRISYDAYDNETGKEVQKRASAEADDTGHRVKPVDIIHRDGDLIRFYEIVRKVWQR